MAKAISEDEDALTCPVCLELLRDPVTIPCGHNFCMRCINCGWDLEDQKGVYSCPLCKHTITRRPILSKNLLIAEMVEKFRRTRIQAASTSISNAGPGDVECGICTGRKRKVVKSCLDCAVSYCETHLHKIHSESNPRKNSVIDATVQLQDMICCSHNNIFEACCHNDQSCICSVWSIDENKRLDTDTAVAEWMIKQKVTTLTDAPCSIISTTATFSQNIPFKAVEESVSALKMQMEEKVDGVFRQHVAKIPAADSDPEIPVGRKSSNDMPELHMSDGQAACSEPKTREEFLQYSCPFTLDPNTAHRRLHLSEGNRRVEWRVEPQGPDHPERLDGWWYQVLCREGVSGRCYWEVEWSSGVIISVSYKSVSRKGGGAECVFGWHDQSWRLKLNSSSSSFWHSKKETILPLVASSRIGVYVDHRAGTLAFYSISDDTMTLLHRVQTTFTQPLYPGFLLLYVGSSVKLS